jgi:hypothetical protein
LPDGIFFQTKTPNLGKFGRVLQWKIHIGIFYFHLVYFQPFDIFYGHLAYFLAIWYIFPVLVCCSKKNLATLLETMVLPNSEKCLAEFFITDFVEAHKKALAQKIN